MPITIDSTSMQTSVASSSSVSGNNITLVPRLTTTIDYDGNSYYENVCAKVTGVNGLTPTFIITTTGGNPAWSTANDTGFFSYDQLTWTQFGNAPVYTGGNVQITHTAAFNQNVVWFARDRREGVVQMNNWLTGLSGVSFLPGFSGFQVDTFTSQTNEVGTTIPAQPLYAFMIGTTSTKPLMVLNGGVHAGEDIASTVYRKAVDYLLASNTEGNALRAKYNFLCLPLCNPPGREGGHWRAQFQLGAGNINDMNRHMFDQPSPFETVGKNRAIYDAIERVGHVALLLDFHMGGQAPPCSGYIAGCNVSFLDQTWLSAATTAFGSSVSSLGSGCQQVYVDMYHAFTKGAPLAQTIEIGQYASKTDGNVVAWGTAIIKTIYAMDQAGNFANIQGPPTGSCFGRHA